MNTNAVKVGNTIIAPDKFRIGIIGLGQVAESHLRAYQQLLEEIKIVAAGELEADRLVHFAGLYGFRPYRNYCEMLQAHKLDLVCVLTPAATHAEITIACAAAGVNVLCEKPLALNLNDARNMIVACEKAGVKLFYGASYRFLPAIQKARELIQAGAIGDLLILREQIVGGAGPESHKPLGAAHYPKGGPGGSGMGLVDHGIHCIDAFAWLCDCAVESVFGRGNISGEQAATEYLHMNLSNGAVGQLLYNDGTYSTSLPYEGIFSLGEGWGVNGKGQPGGWLADPGCIHVYGTQGALRIFYYANVLFLVTRSGIRQVPVVEAAPPAQFAAQLKNCMDEIREDHKTESSGHIGYEALRVLLAAYESSSTGKLARLTAAVAGNGKLQTKTQPDNRDS